MATTTVVIFGLLIGYVLYHIFRRYISATHRIMFGATNTVLIAILFAATLYFFALYRDYPGYYGILIDATSVIFGFVVGICIDKLSDWVIRRKFSEEKK